MRRADDAPVLFNENGRPNNPIHWPLGKPEGNRVELPTAPAIVAIIKEHELTCKLGHNCFELVNHEGDAIEVDYGATEKDWQEAALVIRDYHERTDNKL